jgi:hypothetical protein
MAVNEDYKLLPAQVETTTPIIDPDWSAGGLGLSSSACNADTSALEPVAQLFDVVVDGYVP